MLSGEMSIKNLFEELGIKDLIPGRWAYEYEEMGEDAFPEEGSSKINKDYGIAKLKKKVEKLERESKMLKISGFS